MLDGLVLLSVPKPSSRPQSFGSSIYVLNRPSGWETKNCGGQGAWVINWGFEAFS